MPAFAPAAFTLNEHRPPFAVLDAFINDPSSRPGFLAGLVAHQKQGFSAGGPFADDRDTEGHWNSGEPGLGYVDRCALHVRQTGPIDHDAHTAAREYRIVVFDGGRRVDAIAQARAAGRRDAEAHARRAGMLRQLAHEMPCGTLAQADRELRREQRKIGLRCRGARDLDHQIPVADDRLA